MSSGPACLWGLELPGSRLTATAQARDGGLGEGPWATKARHQVTLARAPIPARYRLALPTHSDSLTPKSAETSTH